MKLQTSADNHDSAPCSTTTSTKTNFSNPFYHSFRSVILIQEKRNTQLTTMASTTSNKHPLLLAAAVAHGVLALGHTVRQSTPYDQSTLFSIVLTCSQTKGLDQFKHPSINTLPTALRGAVKAGWYEGSVFFAIMGKNSPISKIFNNNSIYG
jgi:hypothetical protein